MHKWQVVYSSVTGNTRQIAEAMAAAAEVAAESVEDAALRGDAEIVAVGYWLWRGGPDPKMAAFLPKLHDVDVILFETHAADNRSEHAVTAFARAAYLLGANCRILGTFECQGQVSAAIRAKREKMAANDPHAKTGGWKTSLGHPDGEDIAAAAAFARKMEEKRARLDQSAARRAAKQG